MNGNQLYVGNVRDMDTRQITARKGLIRNGDLKPPSIRHQNRNRIRREGGIGRRNRSQYLRKVTEFTLLLKPHILVFFILLMC